MSKQVVERFRCDACGKTAESPVPDGFSISRTDAPEAWFAIHLYVGHRLAVMSPDGFKELSKAMCACSQACARAAVLKAIAPLEGNVAG